MVNNIFFSTLHTLTRQETRMRYTLSFSCHMSFPSTICAEGDSLPDEAEWIEEAMARIQDGNTWYNYLVSAHGGSMENDGEGEAFPEISAIEISLGEPSEKGDFTGSISWTADEVDLETLEEQLEWFIGDRMCFYEVCDEDEGWHCFINPSGLSQEK